ncbi:ATP-binding cassette domain-containing protein [Alteromonas halophila]|uniref:ABC transporter ATP-binding protein n=1 Tax=Alteromonas halophila TaxID=516698 RepID=A0A918JIP0_9ALTE|nr:ATP-binding cassette domain-containing protein [Alteromonas halophila]GGW77808.1 ABC transporter ATP-binding protein [Alteromonas halophila]
MSLALQQLRIYRHDTCMLSLDCCIAPGEVVSVTGPSGSGKSTLLNVVMGLQELPFRYDGEIMLNGKPLDAVAPHKRNLGMLYQDPLLFEHLTAGENIAFAVPPAARRGQTKTALRDSITAQLDKVGLGDLYTRPVQTLSGGQQARVALLRTLASKPQAVLLDEPFSKLDTTRRAQIRDWVFATLREQQLPALLVTHDNDDVRAAGGRIIEV